MRWNAIVQMASGGKGYLLIQQILTEHRVGGSGMFLAHKYCVFLQFMNSESLLKDFV